MANNLPINSGNQQSSYQRFSYTLAAGEVVTVYNPYNYFTCLDCDAPFNVAWSTNRSATGFEKGLQVKFDNGELIPSVQITNTASTQNTIVFGLGAGNFDDNRLVLTSASTINTLAGQYATFAATTVAISAGIATIPAAKKVIIQNNGANVMYIGGTGTDGLQLMPGGIFEYELNATLTIYGTNGDAIAVGSFN